MTTLVWFRDDLRTADHAALAAAAADPTGVICVYVLDEATPGVRPLGSATKWWLHHSLTSLTKTLNDLGVPLVLRRGPAAHEIHNLVTETGANQVVWNRRYGPEREIDAGIKASLRAQGVAAHSFASNLLHEPWQVTTATGSEYRVFTPFWRAVQRLPAPAAPLPAPGHLRAAKQQPHSEPLDGWHLTPTKPNWATGFSERWAPGEANALEQLETFLDERANSYAIQRDFPAVVATSELAPHLRWGEISHRTVWHHAVASGKDIGTFLSELGWREFAQHTRFFNGALETRNLNPKFDGFPWLAPDPDEFAAWQQGQTGVPLVDAGMRELWHTGYMHNRVRMVAASFLTKHLLTDWRIGEAWFWDTLVDADAASNPFNWQWVAGSGLDASPYFRVFNPELQQQKFDRAGKYVQRWAPDSILTPPLIDLAAGRARALDAYAEIRNG